MKICNHCGAEIPDEGNFCPECGNPTEKDNLPIEKANDEVNGHEEKSLSMTNSLDKDITEKHDGAVQQKMPDFGDEIPKKQETGIRKKILRIVVLALLAIAVLKLYNIFFVATETYSAKGVDFTLVKVDGGVFTMGSDNAADALPHEVKLSDYSIAQTEVTQELYQAVMGENPSRMKGKNKPVNWVSWDDAQAFIARLNEITGEQFRLPTEAEWEYAARGAQKSKKTDFAGNVDVDAVAWYRLNSYDKGNSSSAFGIQEVAGKKCNEIDLYDMSGNVWEWVSDRYGNYGADRVVNPTGAALGADRVWRGGSWGNDMTDCTVYYRGHTFQSYKDHYSGFRLAKSR